MSLLSEAKVWDDTPAGTFLSGGSGSHLKFSHSGYLSFRKDGSPQFYHDAGMSGSNRFHAASWDIVSFIPREFML